MPWQFQQADLADSIGQTAGGSFRFGLRYAQIDPTVSGSWVFDGTVSYPNKVGIDDAAPVDGGRPADSAYVAGAADVSAILAGYDNVVNAQAGLLAAQHSIIYSTADHGSIWGGSFHAIFGGAVYSVIVGGTENTVQADCAYGFIGGGEGNILEAGASAPLSGHRGVIVGGFENLVSGQYGAILNGRENEVTVTYGVVINGELCEVSGNHSAAGGNTILISGAYSFAWGLTHTMVGARGAAFGESHNVAHDYCLAFGIGAIPPNPGTFAYSSRHRGGVAGNNQAISFCTSQETSGAVAVNLSIAGSSNYPTLPEKSSWNGVWKVVGVDLSNGDVSMYTIHAGAKRGLGTTGASVYSGVTADNNGLSLVTPPALSVNTSGNFRINVTGVAGKNIAWTATFVGAHVSWV